MILLSFLILATALAIIGLLERRFRQQERRLAEERRPRYAFMSYYPYVMHLMPPMKGEDLLWEDRFHQRQIRCTVTTNDLGFQTDIDFEDRAGGQSIARIHLDPARQEISRLFGDSKLVLLAGGSTAWGIGAESQQAMISNVIQRRLDAHAGPGRYKVINQAMGGWVSFQQLIGLSRWGRNLPLSWLLCLDGYNDAATTLFFHQGFDKHRFHDVTAGFLNAYMSNLRQPTFFRSEWENHLIEHSALYRRISGKQPIIPPWRYKRKIQTPGGVVFSDGIRWAMVDDSLRFLLQNHDQMVKLSGATKHLFGIHPVPHDHIAFFGKAHLAQSMEELQEAFHAQSAHLDDIFARHREEESTARNWPDALNYFLGKLDLSSRRFQSIPADKNGCLATTERCNLNLLFPPSPAEQRHYFIDSCHLNDRGQKLIAEFFADFILWTDERRAPEIAPDNAHWLAAHLDEDALDQETPLTIQRLLNKHANDGLSQELTDDLRKLNLISQTLSETDRHDFLQELRQAVTTS